MAVATVYAEPTVLTECAAADDLDWLDIGGGAGSSQNTDLFMNGTECRARRIDNVTDVGFWYDNTTTFRFNTYFGIFPGYMWLQVYITHPQQLETIANGGLRVRIGSGVSDWREWAVGGRDTLPTQGGWFMVKLGTNAPQYGTSGSPSNPNMRYVGIVCTMGDVGGAAQNVALGRIIWGHPQLAGVELFTGFKGGTLGDPIGFQEVIDADGSKDPTAAIKRWFVSGSVPAVAILDTTYIGEIGEELHFYESDKLIYLPPQVYPQAQRGLTFNLTHVDSDITLERCVLYGGPGAVVGLSDELGAIAFNDCTLVDIAVFALAPAHRFENCIWDGPLASPSVLAGSVSGCTFKNGAYLILGNAAFAFNGPDGDGEVDNIEFVSGGSGHAMIYDFHTATHTLTLRGHKYEGYGADGTTDAVFHNQTDQQITLLILDDGDVPTVLNSGTSTTIIQKDITFQVACVTEAGDPVILMGPLELTITDTAVPPNELSHLEDAIFGAINYVYPYTDAGNTVRFLAMHEDFEPLVLELVLPAATGTVQVVTLRDDRTFDNPA